jgi:hypothetical protein
MSLRPLMTRGSTLRGFAFVTPNSHSGDLLLMCQGWNFRQAKKAVRLNTCDGQLTTLLQQCVISTCSHFLSFGSTALSALVMMMIQRRVPIVSMSRIREPKGFSSTNFIFQKALTVGASGQDTSTPAIWVTITADSIATMFLTIWCWRRSLLQRKGVDTGRC